MNNEELKKLYEHLVDQAFMTIDLNPYWCMTKPSILYHGDLICYDNTKVRIYMVEDTALSCEGYDIYLWIKYNDEFLEYPLFCDFTKPSKWFPTMRSDKVQGRALEVLHQIASGGKEYLTSQIEEKGMAWETALVISEKRMENVVKISCSCAISAYGQVFHGVKEIEKYCQEQRESSSPYILKRCHGLPCMDQEDDCLGQRFARNYLLCKNKREAEFFMKTFIGIGDVSALEPDQIPTPAGFPPLICYVDRSRYLLLSFREGED